MVLCFRRASWYEMGLRQPTGEMIKEPVTSKYNQMLYIKLGSCIYFLRFGEGGDRGTGGNCMAQGEDIRTSL